MKIPYANDLPVPLRRMGRALMSTEARQWAAAEWQHIAHLSARRDPAFRRSLQKLGELRNSRRGEGCVIIGNGPSLRGENLAALGQCATFCLNRGYLMWREQGLQPSYFIAVNDLVIEQFHREIAELKCPLFLPWEHHRLFTDVPNAIFLEMRWSKRFFPDVRSGAWPGATVTFAAMQVAYHLGFETTVLIGVDHRFATQGPAHKEVVQTRDDENHFSGSYFGKGVRWNLPDLEQSEMAYRMAREAYERDGRRIIDATRSGALEVFDKMSLEDALAVALASNSRLARS